MAIRLTNGQQKTKSYEEMGYHVHVLKQRTLDYKAHLDLTANDVFKKFKELKSDYDNKIIDQGTFLEHLKPFKELFTDDIVYSKELQAEEIITEIRKHIK